MFIFHYQNFMYIVRFYYLGGIENSLQVNVCKPQNFSSEFGKKRKRNYMSKNQRKCGQNQLTVLLIFLLTNNR